MEHSTIDINESTIKTYIESLRPEDQKIRAQLDFGYWYDGKIAILYETRPIWNNPKKNKIANLQKSDFISRVKSGTYTGCAQAESGNCTNLFQNQPI